jgi:maleate cis-trans isomerase
LIELTDEEIAQMEVDAKAYAEAKAKELADAEVKATLKASAKAKLIAGEPLTAEEADTLLV